MKKKGYHHISPNLLTLKQVSNIIQNGLKLKLSKESKARIQKCRNYLDKKLEDKNNTFYGINTGFGDLCNIKISETEIENLQKNLVLSHACGTGDEVPAEIVRLILMLKVQSLSYGFSGIRLETVTRLIYFYNNDILPVIYQQGSLGASGDLAPLAHMSLALMGEGKVRISGKKKSSKSVLKKHGLKPIVLKSKEGIALLNGTQFSTGYGLWNVLKAKKYLKIANLCAAFSIDAFNCHLSPFNHLLHDIRPHAGQRETAAFMCKILKGSEIIDGHKAHVQDPYAFRCVPQVHGASSDAIQYVEKTILTEINSVTDNPNIFPDEDKILSGGNFHAQPIALALDFLAIAVAELGSISERRTYQLISGERDLPAFLTPRPGLHSGMMIPQYTAASIVSQSKQLCTPASVDSIVSSNGQEDHVSMAANSATKLHSVLKNTERVLAIELMNAIQALDFRTTQKTSPKLEKIRKKYRAIVPFLDKDRLLSEDIHKSIEFIQKLSI